MLSPDWAYIVVIEVRPSISSLLWLLIGLHNFDWHASENIFYLMGGIESKYDSYLLNLNYFELKL